MNSEDKNKECGLPRSRKTGPVSFLFWVCLVTATMPFPPATQPALSPFPSHWDRYQASQSSVSLILSVLTCLYDLLQAAQIQFIPAPMTHFKYWAFHPPVIDIRHSNSDQLDVTDKILRHQVTKDFIGLS